jgi:hypothetical protein
MAKNGEVLLGQKCKCIVTGFEGTVTSTTEYLFGCRRIGLQPEVGIDGKIPDAMDIDEPQIAIIDKKQVIKASVPKKKIKLGQIVKDEITGYEGTAMGRVIHLNGCTRIGVQEKYDPSRERDFCNGKWFYEHQLAVVKIKVEKKLDKPEEFRRTGGPTTKSVSTVQKSVSR